MTDSAHQQIPAPQGPTASTAPIRELFQANRTGVSPDGNYVVIPAALAEQMPLRWQQAFAQAIGQLQQETSNYPWPMHAVTPCRYALVSELPEDKLKEVGIVHELTDTGDMVHRWIKTGETIPNPDQQQVLVSCPDPLLAPPAQPHPGSQ